MSMPLTGITRKPALFIEASSNFIQNAYRKGAVRPRFILQLFIRLVTLRKRLSGRFALSCINITKRDVYARIDWRYIVVGMRENDNVQI